MKELITVILDNSFFKFEMSYFKQMQGLPMWNKVSAILADTYLNQSSIKFFARYVVDWRILNYSTDEANRIFQIFNKTDQHIKFEIEHPQNDKIHRTHWQ
jgi:hypothetical protein